MSSNAEPADNNIAETTEAISRSEAETRRIAAELAARLKPHTVIALSGNLGAGKTRFAQGLACALGVGELVSSPTFALANAYSGRNGAKLMHLDLYRLASEDAVEELGFEEMREEAHILAVEWPEIAENLLPENTVRVFLSIVDEDSRRIVVSIPKSALKAD